MWFGFSDKIWLYRQAVDFRKQIDGLVLIVADILKQDPTSGHLFAFRNRTSNKIKLLWWDTNGFWLIYKRLEKGKFVFPNSGDATWQLTKDELSWLLSGLNLTHHMRPTEVKACNFF